MHRWLRRPVTSSVLVVEDHADLAETVGEYLTANGYQVDYAADGLIAVHLASQNAYDIIVLDIMLPGMDGISVCRHLREVAAVATPIIMLTAKDQLDSKLEGFSAGADDYLVKPFDLPELQARIDALLRRDRGLATRYQVADLVLDTETLEVTRAGDPLMLPRICFDILKTLMRDHPKVVTRAALEQELWGDDPPDSDALRSHFYNLRQIVDRPFAHALIETLPGRGYRLKPPAT